MSSNLIQVVAERNEHWTHLNLRVMEDPRVTWKSKAVHTYLISRPPNWVVQRTDLINRSPQGREALQSALKELEEFGYLVQERIQNKSTGQFEGCIIRVFEESQDDSNADNRVNRLTENPLHGKPDPLVVNSINNNNDKYVSSTHKGVATPPPRKRLQKIGKYSGMDEELHKAAKTPGPIKEIKIPDSLKPVVAKWGEVAIAHGASTKALREGMRALRGVRSGKFFEDKNGYAAKARPYEVRQILKALETFDTMRNNPDFLPADKKFLKRQSLASFFYSPHVRNGDGAGGGSLFLQCLKSEPSPVVVTDPEMTKFVHDMLYKNLGVEVDAEAVARATNKLMRYWKNQKDQLKGWGVPTPKRLVVTWMDMLNERFGGTWDVGNVLGKGMEQVYEKHIRSAP